MSKYLMACCQYYIDAALFAGIIVGGIYVWSLMS